MYIPNRPIVGIAWHSYFYLRVRHQAYDAEMNPSLSWFQEKRCKHEELLFTLYSHYFSLIENALNLMVQVIYKQPLHRLHDTIILYKAIQNTTLILKRSYKFVFV
jgi:hypothetical protein